MNVLLGTALLTAIGAAVVRRKAFGCKFEAPPSVIVVSSAAAAYLTSAHASRNLGPPLHDITGIWNFEDLLGHVLWWVCVLAAVKVFIIRFGSDPIAQELYWKWALQPVIVSVPVLITCRAFGESSQRYMENFDQMDPSPWMSCYWLTVFGVTFWLLIVASALALTLRFEGSYAHDANMVLNLYLFAMLATTLSLSVLSVEVYTDIDTDQVAWALAYIGVMCWAAAPAYSWWCKTRPLTIASPDELASSG